MLKLFRSKPALAILAVTIAAAAVLGLRMRKQPLPPAAPAIEQDSNAASTQTTDDQPVTSVSTNPIPVEPPAASPVQAKSPAPEPAAQIASPTTKQPVFEDARAFDKLETPVHTGPAQELTAALPARTGSASGLTTSPTTPPPFMDVRPPVLPSPTPPKAPALENSTAQVAINRPTQEAATVPTAVTASPRQAPLPTFTDQRDLEPSASRIPAAIERREAPTPTLAAPRFVDSRDPILATESTRTTTLPVQHPSTPDIASPAATVRTAAAAVARSVTNCEPAQITSEPLDGGRMLVRVGTPCRADQIIKFGYGDANVIRKLDGAGRLELTLDLFAGTSSPIAIVFEDGSSRELTARASDLDKLEKIALIWRAPVDLDLHAFEYGASFGQPGHVWSQSPSSALAAREQVAASHRGRGFLSRTDSGEGSGDKIEVYTFLRYPDQPAGVVSIAIDYASRGDTPSGANCGNGALAEVKFETVVTARGRVSREAGILAPVACGASVSADARYGITHQIRVNR